MLFAIIGIVILSCIFLIIWRSTKGPVHTIETLERPIKDLLKRGYDEGFLIIDIYRSEYFIQLRKYIHAPGNYGIMLCFPNAKWSESVFVKLSEFCRNNGIEYSIAEEKADKPLEFLYIDFGKDISKACKVIKDIILKVFELDKCIKLFVRLENATIEEELIDQA